METIVQETSGNMPVDEHLINALGTKQGMWTMESLGLEVEDDTIFTKEKFEQALKKVSHKIKK